MSKLFKICDSGLKLTFSLFGNLEIEGKENVPKKGSFITVANHLSIIDPASVSYTHLTLPTKA